MVRFFNDWYNDCYRVYIDSKEIVVFCALDAAQRSYPNAKLVKKDENWTP